LTAEAGASGAAAPDEKKKERTARPGALGWLQTRGPRFARWLLLLFIASLFVPALTKQWNDRKQELDVKETLATDVSKVSANAVYGAVAALRLKGPEQKAAFQNVQDTWLRDRAAIDPRFRVYFPHSQANRHWFQLGQDRGYLGFRNAVYLYALLPCCDNGSLAKRLGRLRLYLGPTVKYKIDKDPWQVLVCGPHKPTCTSGASYLARYRWLGNQILGKRQVLLDELLEANGAGFSSGYGDFVRDLNPLG
jgi:hypothetical protein